MEKVLFNLRFLGMGLVLVMFCSMTSGFLKPANIKEKNNTVLFGQASFYADKFHGRPTASGENYNSHKLTAACNSLPLGTWIKVTNLGNGKHVIVKTNDRLHVRMARLIDLSKLAAEKLGYVHNGLARVKVEVMDHGNSAEKL